MVQKHHWLLVTLLLCNAAAMEALPLFLDRLVSPYVAIMLSVTAVLLFGEVIPQAVCSRYGLAIGSFLSPMVKFLIYATSPISYPLAKALDVILGTEHDTFFRRAQIKALVTMHDPEHGGPLTPDEVQLIKGAIDLSNKTVETGMTPLENCFMLELSEKFDLTTMQKVLSRGHSRVPVYKDNPQNILGLLMVKNLIHLDPDDATPVSSLELRPIPHVLNTMPMYDLLHFMQSGRSHMVVVVCPEKDNIPPADGLSEDIEMSAQPSSSNGYGQVLGIITLEDILEEIIQSDIIDETDVYVDNVKRLRVAEFVHQLKHMHKDDQKPLDWHTPRHDWQATISLSTSRRASSASNPNLIVPTHLEDDSHVSQPILSGHSIASS